MSSHSQHKMRPENIEAQQAHYSRAVDIERWIATVSSHPQHLMSSSNPLEVTSSDGEEQVAPRQGISSPKAMQFNLLKHVYSLT